MRKSKFKQTMSMLLAVLMVFMSMNFSVFAEELTAPTDETTTTTVEAPAEQPAEKQTPAVEALAPVDEETRTTEENAVIQETPAMMALSDSEYLTPGTPALDEMTGKECFFANGTPITIEATTTEGKGAKITWDGGSQEVSSAANIFGGGHNHDGTYESTSVTMTGGTVNAVFGGGLHKSHVATANVVIKDGAVIGQIAGGAASSFSGTTCHQPWPGSDSPNAFVDTANATIEGGTIKGSALVYGGGEGMSQTGNTNLNITGGTFDKAYIIPGGSNGTTTGTAKVEISTDIKDSIVQGINRGKTENIVIDIKTGAKVNKVYAGGETGDSSVTGTIEKTTVNIAADSAVANLQPGTNGGIEIAPNSTELITLNYDDSAVINEGENTLEKLETRFGAAVLGKTTKAIAVADVEEKVISGYDDIQTAVDEAPSDSIIKLQKNIDVNQTIQYGNKNLTFDGNNKTYKLTSTAKDRIFMLTGTGDTGTGLTLINLEVIGNNTNQRGIHVGDITDTTDNNHYKSQITLDNAELKFDFCVDPRGINFGDGQHQGSVITLTNNSKILNGLNQEYENNWGNSGNGSRGLSLWNPEDVTVNIEKNSALKGFKYAVNVSGTQQVVGDKLLADAEGLNVTVDNSTIYGWAAFNIWASYGTYNIQNGSVLKGINTVKGTPGSANDFTTIKLNYDWPSGDTPAYQTYDNVLNITDSTITNSKTGDFDQDLLTIDNAETIKSVNLEGAHFVDATGTIDSAITVYDNGDKSGSISKAIAAVKAKTLMDAASTSVYQPAEGEAKSLSFYDIIAVNSEKEYQNLQEAIDDAADNDTITVKEGTHNLDQTLLISKPVTIKGEDNKTVVITRGDTWSPESSTEGSQGSLIHILNTNNVTLENLTVTGARKVEGTTNANGHGINIVQSTGVTLKNITSKDNAAAGVVVNGSTVTATGLYTSGNGWYGVNVDQGSGVTDDTLFTLKAPYRFGETYQIVSDKYNSNDNIEVNLPDAFVQSDLENGSVYWNDSSTMIKNQNKNRTYPTIQAAIDDANRNNTILIPAGTYAEDLNIKQSVTLKKAENAESDCVLDGNITVTEGKKVTLSDMNAGTNAAVMVKKGANLALVNSDAFVENQHITVEKLFGTEYDTSVIKQNDQEVAKDKLSFVYLGEEIKPDMNLLRADEVSYTVKTPAQFYWLSQQINEGDIDASKVMIKLGNDLDFHNDEWLPVGVEGHDYKGTFDGQNHKISNLYVNKPGKNYTGLFGKAWGAKELGNVIFENVEIIGSDQTGVLTGQFVGSAISNVQLLNYQVNGNQFVGGIVGYSYTNMYNCNGENGVVVANDQDAGGLMGFNGEGNYQVKNCTVKNVEVESRFWDCGGIIGSANSNIVLQNCKSEGGKVSVRFKQNYGQILGRVTNAGASTIYNCTSDTPLFAYNSSTGMEERLEDILVGGNQDYIKTLTVYNENNETPYATIQEAIDKANSGDTIKIGAGTYDEAITLTKAVNLIGPYADTEIKAEEATTDNRPDESEAILTGGINITRPDKDSSESISIKGLKFTKSGIYSVGWGNDPNLNSITIENNVFENIANELNNSEKNVSAIHFNLADNQPVQNCTIKNNRISGVANGDSSGINVFTVSGATTITGNYIENTNHSALQIQGTATGDVTITGNTFKNWDQDVANGGRAMRFGKFAKVDSMTVTNNKMIRALEPGEDKDQMAKFDTIPDEGSLDFSLNYWNGKLPVTTYGKAEDSSVIVISDGSAKINALPYYADEEMKRPLVPVEVKDSTGNLKGNYLTIPEAVADAETKDHIVISEGIQTLSSSITIPSGKDLTFEGTVSDSGALLTTLQRSAVGGDGNNIIFSVAQENVQTTVKNLNFVTTKEGASTFYSDKKSAELTIEGCSFNSAEGINYGGNIVMGAGVENTGKLSFVNNKVNFSFRNGINAAGNNSVITGNEFVYTSDRINDSNRTSVLSLVADDNSGIITITDNIFKNANRAIAVDNSKMLSGNKVTIKDNQFIDVRYGFELGSTVNKGCGVYDLSKNYYARTQPDGSGIAAPMLIEDADISEGTHFDGSRDYKGDQVNVYPYYVDKEMTKTYAPLEVQHKDEGAKNEYFGIIAKAYEAAHAGDTIVINRAANGSDAVIDEAVDMNTKDADLKLMGSTTFNGTFAGSTRASLILENGTTATFTNAEQNAIQYFTSVDVENFNSETPTQIVAPTVNTSQNSFIAKGGLMDYVKGDPNSIWTYGSPSDRFNGGDGTAEKPWQINTPEQMKLLQTPEFKTKDKYFKLTNDINVSDWDALAKFEGSFNGNGYSITGNAVNFIDELSKDAKVEKLRFEGFTNLVNTNNGTIENCYTVGEKTPAIVNIMGSGGALTDSFTAGTKAVQTNEAQGTVLRVYHCGETGGIGTAMTKADMQKARFANTLNGNEEGVWGYDADVEAPSAYPFVMKDDKTTTIQKLGEVNVSCDASIGKVSIVQPDDGIYAKDTITLKAEITNSNYDFLSWTNASGEIIGTNRTCDYTVRTKDDVGTFTANFTRKPTITVSALNFNASAGSISVNGIENSNAVNAEINVGTMARLKATPKVGYKFVKWTTLQDMNTAVSVEDTFTIYAGTSNLQYLAHFEEIQADKVTVSFKNSVTGAIIGQPQTIDKNGEVAVPEAPVYLDRDFVGWYDGNIKASVVNGKIQNVQKDTTYEARYTQKHIQYTVTVTNGSIDGEQGTSVQKDANSRVTVIANTPEQGKQFAGWKYANGDSIISYDATYTFTLKADTSIEATYSELPVEKQPTVSIDPNPVQIDQSEGLYKLRFIVRSEVPDDGGYTPIKCGIVAKEADVANPEELALGAADVIVGGKTNIGNQYTYTVNLGNLAVSTTVSARGYLTYMKNGETYTIYTDMVKGTVVAN